MTFMKDPFRESCVDPSLLASYDDVLKVASLYEQKCILINRETDFNGMGRYQ